jgi:hypothetical protein
MGAARLVEPDESRIGAVAEIELGETLWRAYAERRSNEVVATLKSESLLAILGGKRRFLWTRFARVLVHVAVLRPLSAIAAPGAVAADVSSVMIGRAVDRCP